MTKGLLDRQGQPSQLLPGAVEPSAGPIDRPAGERVARVAGEHVQMQVRNRVARPRSR